MVDRIKFVVDNCEIEEQILKKKFFAAIENKKKGVKTFLFKYNVNEDEENEDEENENENGEPEKYQYGNKYKKHLYIKYVVHQKPKNLPNNSYPIKSELVVHQNIRKRYFGEGKIADLNLNQFIKVIEKIGIELNIEKKLLWNARVTKLELGVTLRLNSNMKGILTCFDSFRGLTDKNIYADNGISFIGENFSVSVYDKLKKMDDNKELFKKSKNKKKMIQKVTKNNYFLRLELKIEKVSGFYRDNNTFKEKVSRLKEIKTNWDYLGKSLYKMYEDINYIDTLSPEVMNSILGNEYKPMDDYLKFQGIKKLGEAKFFNQLIPLMKNINSSQSKFKKRYRDFYNDFERKYKVDYQHEFSSKLDEKIEKLMRK